MKEIKCLSMNELHGFRNYPAAIQLRIVYLQMSADFIDVVTLLFHFSHIYASSGFPNTETDLV